MKHACEHATNLDTDTVCSNRSYDVACFAVGTAVKAAEVEGFALIRPPDHHASKGMAMGFCLFNNIAIASKHLVEQGKTVFILDFDLHHGNGTQDIVLGDKDIKYFSAHLSPFFPGTGLKSEGNCINVPMRPGTKDDEYVKIVETHLKGELEMFNPDVVAVSAGFDSLGNDPLNNHQLDLTEKSYEAIREVIRPYKRFFCLEGGYDADNVKKGVDIFTRRVLSPSSNPLGGPPAAST